jgi:hypothetical protein
MVKPRGVAIEDKVPSIIDILVGVGLRQGSSLFFTDVSINATNISLSLSLYNVLYNLGTTQIFK